MLGEALKVGDLIQVKVAKENREWGYNPCPDGTIVKVVGFGTIPYSRINNFGYEPGIYLNHCWPEIQFATGEKTSISCCFLEPADIDFVQLDDLDKAHLTANYFANTTLLDDATYTQRQKVIRAQSANGGVIGNVKVKVADLPETEFYEGDVVTSPYIKADPNFPNGRAVIATVHYEYIGKYCSDGYTPMPLYNITSKLGAGWTANITSREILDFTLVERGPVWKHYHNEPVQWANVEEEAKFFKMLGHTTEVRNPVTNLYSYTKDEALSALKSGIADAISVGSMFGSDPMTSVWKFNDPVLGAKVRALTLKGFGVA